MKGTVKWFNEDKRFGFITPDGGGKDVFVHQTALKAIGLDTIKEGVKVSFELEDNKGRSSAVSLALL